nr:protein Aucsia-2 isoform X1 [Solanum lycopersicum]
MAPLPGPYSGTSTLALVARTSAFTFGLVYGSMKLKYLKVVGNYLITARCA